MITLLTQQLCRKWNNTFKKQEIMQLKNNRDVTKDSVSFSRNLVGKTLGLEFLLFHRLANKIPSE